MVVAFFCTKGLYVRNSVPGHLTDSQDFDSIVNSRKEKKRTERSEKDRKVRKGQKKTETDKTDRKVLERTES